MFVAACAYLGDGFFGSAARRLDTAEIRSAAVADSISLEGIAVRREELISAPAGAADVEAGTRVPAGALLFTDRNGGAVTAPSSALCFFDCDGYEALSPDMLHPFSLDRVEALLDFSPARTGKNACRLVYDHCWYFAAVAQDPPVLPEPGKVELRFDGMGQSVPARLTAVSSEGGQTALLLRLTCGGAEYMSLRKTSAELILAEYSGLEIPARAVRHDEDGNEYVCILTAGRIERRMVEIIYTDGEICIAAASSGADALHEGCTVILDIDEDGSL